MPTTKVGLFEQSSLKGPTAVSIKHTERRAHRPEKQSSLLSELGNGHLSCVFKKCFRPSEVRDQRWHLLKISLSFVP